MIRNYLKVALRTLWRHRDYSLINILGLAIGLASSIFIPPVRSQRTYL